MSYLPSLADDARLLDVLRAHPESARPLLRFHEVVLRGPSPLSVAERELIAAYVSGLNSCSYCHGIHAGVAEAFGIPEGRLSAMLSDLDAAELEDRMRPLLRYVRTLTLTPARVTPGEADAVLAAGWSEQALHDAVAVCALFNMMNRYVDGLGVAARPDYTATSAHRLAAGGYAALLEFLDDES